MKLFPPPLHLCLYIILKRQSAFPLTLRLVPFPSLPHTYMRIDSRWKSTACSLYLCHTGISTHTHTHDGRTHAHKQAGRTRERDPKHQNSINPLRRSLKGFLKADFHHTEAFQVSTVCGGNGAEAFKLHAFTYPLCYLLFLPFSHTVFLLLSFCIFSIPHVCPCISSETGPL